VPVGVPPRRSSSKKWVLIGAIVVVGAIAAAAAALQRLNTPPPEPIEVERPKIEAAMAEYRSAYRNRDLEGVARVFPTLPANTRRSMEQAFADCIVYEVTFSEMQVALDPTDPTRGQVDLRSIHQCTPSSGGRQTNIAHRDLFSLKKSGDAWEIESAAAASADRP
jgi:hypothetical protein